MYNHNKAQQSKNRVHISWDILYIDGDLVNLYLWKGPLPDVILSKRTKYLSTATSTNILLGDMLFSLVSDWFHVLTCMVRNHILPIECNTKDIKHCDRCFVSGKFHEHNYLPIYQFCSEHGFSESGLSICLRPGGFFSYIKHNPAHCVE